MPPVKRGPMNVPPKPKKRSFAEAFLSLLDKEVRVRNFSSPVLYVTDTGFKVDDAAQKITKRIGVMQGEVASIKKELEKYDKWRSTITALVKAKIGPYSEAQKAISRARSNVAEAKKALNTAELEGTQAPGSLASPETDILNTDTFDARMKLEEARKALKTAQKEEAKVCKDVEELEAAAEDLEPDTTGYYLYRHNEDE